MLFRNTTKHLSHSFAKLLIMGCNLVLTQAAWSAPNGNCVDSNVSISSTPAIPLCENEGVIFAVTDDNLPVIGWAVSDHLDFSIGPVQEILNGETSISFPAGFVANKFVRAILSNSGTDLAECPVLYSPVYNVPVIQPVQSNTISSDVTSFDCDFSGVLEVTGTHPGNGSNANFYLWQMSLNGTSWQLIGSGSNLQNISISPQLGNNHLYLRRIVNPPACDADTSNILFIINNNLAIGGILTGGGSFCEEDETISLELTGYVGEIAQWEQSPNGTGFEPVPGSEGLSILNVTPNPGTTTYRVRVENGACVSTYSNTQQVQVFAQSSAGNFQNETNVQHLCPGDVPELLTLENYVGAVVNWHIAAQPNGPWTPLEVFEDTFQPDVFTENQYIKAEVQNDGCPAVFTAVYALHDHPEITSNTISANQLICEGETPSLLAGAFPSGGTGNYAVNWIVSTDGVEWELASGQSNQMNYQPPAIFETTFYKRLVTSGECLVDSSNAATIEVSPPVQAEFSGGGFVCAGSEGTINVDFIGNPPFTLVFNDGSGDITVEGITENNYNVSFTIEQDITTISFLAVGDAICGLNELAEAESILFWMIPEPAPPAAGDTAVCGLSVSLQAPDNENDNFFTHWTNDANELLSTSPAIEFSAETPGTYFLTLTTGNGLCGTSYNAEWSVTLDTPETAYAGEDILICDTEVQLQADSVLFGVGYWLAPVGINVNDPFNHFAVATGFEHGNSYPLLWVTQSAMGICGGDTSVVMVQVDEPAAAGNLFASDTLLCAGSTVFLNLDGTSGSDITWWVENSNGIIESLQSGEANCEIENISQNMNIWATVVSGVCGNDTSNAVMIHVEQPPAAGILGPDAQVCTGANQGTISLSGNTAPVSRWEISTNAFADFEVIESNQESYSFQNIEITTQFRVKVEAEVCPSVLSNIATVSVFPYTETEFEIPEFLCSDDENLHLDEINPGLTGGTWFINGNPGSILNPSLFEGSEVAITYSPEEGSCGDDNTQLLTVILTPEAAISGESQVCGSEVALLGSPSGGEWLVPDELLIGEISEESGMTEMLALSFGEHLIQYTATNEVCSNTTVHSITFYEPIHEAHAGPDQYLNIATSTELSALPPTAGEGMWSAGDNNQIQFSNPNTPNTLVSNLSAGANLLLWTISNGPCPTVSDKLIVHVNPLEAPNAFSPNGDNVNDFYEIKGISALSPVKLKVMSRWGDEVFMSNDYQNQWDGRHKNGNDLPPDTYFYVLETPHLAEPLKGFIVLQR
ncbi:MAG: gliding motility-associated C-terminal domain-containing protein [Cryomorphaceae bacterium]|nr:MAG: gliding motility-associated C-terminal domain-containing protein [Cryomorphaceae bacterium]